MILLIDNYDSFTHVLAQTLGILGAEVNVCRNDAITVAAARALRPTAVVISSGSGAAERAGISIKLIQALSGAIPLLGVSLGHQAIGVAFGADVIPTANIAHGKAASIHHNQTGLYAGLKSPFLAGCYHSLVLLPESLPPNLIADAKTEDGREVMGLRHRDHPTFGVQFHPESILTSSGKRLLRNFLELVNHA